jgi:hypothetical protein
MAILTRDRPDPKYYTNIVQYDNGDWAADPLALEDTTIYPVRGGYSSAGILVPGLRTITSNSLKALALQLINTYAPSDLQRNALFILTTQTSGTAWTNAKAMMDWIVAVNAYRDTQIANINTLNFNQIVTYIPPTGMPPWPAPPAGLTPVPPARVGSATHKLRYS